MSSNKHILEQLLDDKSVAKVTIHSNEAKTKKYRDGIKTYKIDTIEEDENYEGKLSIKVQGSKTICDCFNMQGWPSCDYLYIRSGIDKTIFYLIERGDIRAAFRKGMQKLPATVPIDEDELDTIIREIPELHLSRTKKVKRKKNHIRAKLIINRLVEENRRKFAYSIDAVFRMQMDSSTDDPALKRQTYNFVILDIPKPEELVLGMTNFYAQAQVEISQILATNFIDYKKKIADSTRKNLEGLDAGKRSNIRIGRVISEYEELIDDINSNY